MRAPGFVLAVVILASGAVAAPGRDGDKQPPIGAAARARHGPEPLAAPPGDVGMAEDPVDANDAAPVAASVPPAKVVKPKG